MPLSAARNTLSALLWPVVDGVDNMFQSTPAPASVQASASAAPIQPQQSPLPPEKSRPQTGGNHPASGATPPQKPLDADELARLAAQTRVAGPKIDNGAFSSLTTDDAMAWIVALGHINEIDPRMHAANPTKQREIAMENLRLGLWDVQRSVIKEKKTGTSRPNICQDSITSSPRIRIQRPRISTYSGLIHGQIGKNLTPKFA